MFTLWGILVSLIFASFTLVGTGTFWFVLNKTVLIGHPAHSILSLHFPNGNHPTRRVKSSFVWESATPDGKSSHA